MFRDEYGYVLMIFQSYMAEPIGSYYLDQSSAVGALFAPQPHIYNAKVYCDRETGKVSTPDDLPITGDSFFSMFSHMGLEEHLNTLISICHQESAGWASN